MGDPAAVFDENSLFRTLFSAYPDALIVADEQGRIVLANDHATRLLGYAIDQLVGLNVDMLVPDAIRPRHASFRAGYAQHPRPRPMGTQMDLVAKRRDGSEVMVEIALSPLQGQGLPLVVAAIRDIGAYPRVRQALQRARYSEHLAQLGRIAVDARDPNRLLEQVPAIAAEALEVETSRVLLLEPDRLHLRVAAGVGTMPGEPLPDRGGQRLPLGEAWRRVIVDGEPLTFVDTVNENGEHAQALAAAGLRSALAVPLFDRGRVIGLLSAASSQPLRFAEHELRFLSSLSNLLATSLQRAQSEEALDHAQRLESVGQLTGGIAHDFNNLLTVIHGNLQVLEELPAVAGSAHAQELVAAAARASRRGAELTSKLLAFSRRQVLMPSAVDVQSLLASLADMLRRTLDQRIRIELDLPDDAVAPPVDGMPGAGRAALTVRADAAQLESALLNIAINARDAMPEGGRLRFVARACSVLPDEVLHELDDPTPPARGFVSIAVVDDGAGMPEAVKERAFEPFFTTKEPGRGTGLGLSTVYGFVKQSHGAIALESAPGAGTRLTLYIPRPIDAAASSADDPTDARQPPPGLRVLLVEDDPDVRSVARSFLEALGCRVSTAPNGEQALHQLAPAEAPFDLLLTDIALGAGMRGTQLAAEAQRRFPRLAILLMSGYSAELLEADRDSPPDWELLPKPYTREELARAVSRVVAAGSR